MSTRLGELLVKRGLISPAHLERAIAHRENEDGNALSTALVALRLFTDVDLTAFLQREYRLPLVDPAAMDVPPEVARLIPPTLARRHHLVPISLTGSTLTLAMSDPSNLVAINEVKFLTGYDVKVAVAATSSVSAAIASLYDQGIDYNEVLAQVESENVELVRDEEEVDLKELERATEDAPVVRLVNAVLTSAIKRRASDIHL